MDDELIKIVFEDLDYITKEWNAKEISDANLRHSSTILRTLLIERKLFDVARSFDIQKIRIMSSNEDSPSWPDPVLHQAGGGKHKGLKIDGFSVYNKTFTSQEIKEKSKIALARKSKPIELNKYLKNSSIIINGIEINREEIIKYVSNKLGGAHYDKKRGDPLNKEGNISLEGKYALLDDYKNSNKLAGKNSIYFELLEIGQKLVNNRDIQKLKKKIKIYLQKR
ncbi:hypothetical protein ACFL3C_00260 [Patescibacteria group bacterium]